MNDNQKQYNDIRRRLDSLRKEMQKNAIDVLIIPGSDPHLSEYPPDHWCTREWFSGFTGSAGILVVGERKASLWVDSRYWTQAEQQLEGTGIDMCRIESGKGALPYVDWIADNFSVESCVAIDGYLVSLEQGRMLAEKLKVAHMSFRTDIDPVSNVWKDRPGMPGGAVFEHSLEYTGRSRKEKITLIRSEMKKTGAQWHFVSSLDDIAWILNLRGNDIAYNPVFLSYLLLGESSVVLMVDKEKIPHSLFEALEKDGVEIKPYDSVPDVLAKLPAKTALLYDPRRTSYALSEVLDAGIKRVEAINPSILFKSRKTPVEIAHIRRTMLEDGAAFCEFQAWFDTETADGGNGTITEWTISEKIESFRRVRPDYVSPSFGTIAGFNANAALPHYQATEKKHAVIKGDGLLLIDTGGQYLGGTTDMTRVIAVGKPQEAQKKDFTLVLKGLIALSETGFPRSIPAAMLDAIARKPLWRCGLDYGHGTGHGVGYFLNVHEGPQGISWHARPEPQTAMEEGMVTSIEPGLYREGKWGIRLENLVVNQAFQDTAFGRFLCFETLTLCPIDTRCIDRSLLTEEETAWLNRYHDKVRESLMPLVPDHVRGWLAERTKPV